MNEKDKDFYLAKRRIYERLKVRQKLGVISSSERYDLWNQIKNTDLEKIKKIEGSNSEVFRLLQGGVPRVRTVDNISNPCRQTPRIAKLRKDGLTL